MHMLNRRTQLLLDDDRYERLQRRAQESGDSVAALIRDAIDRTYPEVSPDRARAGREFLREARKDPMKVSDWPEMKRAINHMWDKHADDEG